MATALESRLRKLEAAARDDETAALFIVAADEAEAERRIAEVGLTRGEVTIITTGVHRAPKGPAE